MIRPIGFVVALVLLIAGTPLVRGEKPADPKPQYHPVIGPSKISLGANLATLDLPAGYVFLNATETKALLKASNGISFDHAVGLVAPAGEEDFSILIQFDESGYVEDGDAAKLDADGIFKTLKEGNDEANEERKENGFPALDLLSWSEKPRYEAKAHHVVWGLVVRGSRGTSVNFNTRILGRRGVLSLNMVAKQDAIEGFKPRIADILARTTFNEGQRYADYKPGTDKTAAGGLTGLIIGGSALALGSKVLKLGFLAKFSKIFLSLFLALKKLWIVLLAGAGSLLKKFFGGGDKKEDPPEPAA